MAEKILESILTGLMDLELLLTWLRGDNLEEVEEHDLLQNYGRNEFTAFFLSYLRTEIDSVVEMDSVARTAVGAATPRSEGRAHRRAASDPTQDIPPGGPHHSPSREKKRSGRKVKTKLFTEDRAKEPPSPDDARITSGVDRLALATSTPVKSDSSCSTPRTDSTRSPATPGEPRTRHRHDATLGDFLTTTPHAPRGKKKKNKTGDDSREGDLSSESKSSSSSKKSSSLRSERRRIKPTNIDLTAKSVSLGSFGAEFQKGGALALEPSEVFSAPPLLNGGSGTCSPSFSAERDALRRERHRLLEKFSSLSAATSPRCTTPLIKISCEDAYLFPDATKVTFVEQIEMLVNVYQVLLDSHLVLTYTSELCFLLAPLGGRQRADAAPCAQVTAPLRSAHNAAWFAARALRSQRAVLCALLDRHELRALAEARAVRALAPDLAKSLLDVYGLRGEALSADAVSVSLAGHVVAWNTETDGADNFPTAHSFHSFKKQRDMFYDIARWHSEGGAGGAGGAGGSLRTRLRALLAAGGGGQANLAHLGVLVARHVLATAAGGGQNQESRLSKLQRRLTQPPAHQANSLFAPEEQFYKDLLSCGENEPFRCAVRDALATELLALDASPVHSGAVLVGVSRRLAALARLLGLLAALPYCPQHPPAPRPPRPLPYILALRSYAVPTLDVLGLVAAAQRSGRLCVTLPWASAYLCTLAASDAAAPRLPPYARLLRLMRTIYRRIVPRLPARCSLYLRCTLSTLFAQPHIPQELLYEDYVEDEEGFHTEVSGLDAADIITETELAALCGARRELAALLAGGPAAGARHVTPLRVGPSPNRATQRYTQIQKRLEEAVVRSCGGGSARRVLELVCERTCAGALPHVQREINAHRHAGAAGAGAGACRPLLAGRGALIRQQIQTALDALLGESGAGARGAAGALAERAVRARLRRLTADTGELCPAASAGLRALVGEPWGGAPAARPAADTPAQRVDVAAALIQLKECVCLALENTPPSEDVLCSALEGAARAAGIAGKGGRRAALQLSVELGVALACCDPERLSAGALDACARVWAASAAHAHTDKATDELDDLAEVFARVVSPRAVRQASSRGGAGWAALRRLVLRATASAALTPDQLTESCVALYSREWPPSVLAELGAFLRDVSGALERGGADATHALMLGFLGEYCDDLSPAP